MPDLRKVKRARTIFLSHTQKGVSVETALVRTARHVNVSVDDLWEWYQEGRFDTLDNEVLCPDDENDRQAMKG